MPFVRGRRIGKRALQKSKKQLVDGPTNAVSKSCAIVTQSPFCNDARKHWLNDPPIWINSPTRRNHETYILVTHRGNEWRPSQILHSTIGVILQSSYERSKLTGPIIVSR